MKFVIACMMLLFLVQCKSRAQQEPLKLFLPKGSEKPAEKSIYPKTTLTLLLTGSNKIFYHTGAMNKGASVKKTGYKEVRDILKKTKKVIGDSLVVLIKPAPDASYQNTVDILDEMSINNIERYALVDLTIEDAEYLGIEFTPPVEQNQDAKEKVIGGEVIDESKDILMVFIRKDGTIEYGFGKGTKHPLTTLPQADTLKLGSILKELTKGKSGFEVVLKGDDNARYPVFKHVINAMKENEWFRFKMISVKE